MLETSCPDFPAQTTRRTPLPAEFSHEPIGNMGLRNRNRSIRTRSRRTVAMPCMGGDVRQELPVPWRGTRKCEYGVRRMVILCSGLMRRSGGAARACPERATAGSEQQVLTSLRWVLCVCRKGVARDRDDHATVCAQCRASLIDSLINILLFQGPETPVLKSLYS